MPFSVIIPARYASTRLEGKALLLLGGVSMVERVYRRAQQSAADEVVVATDDQRIADVVAAFGGECAMTAASHRSGTDRVAEVVRQRGYADDHVVVNVQGDEPEIPPAAIDQVAALLMNDREADIATLCEPIEDSATLFDPNVVKLVRDVRQRALYFSRAPLPWRRDWVDSPGAADVRDVRDVERFSQVARRHVGIYAYRASILPQFISWPVSALEQSESLEQLRALENGATILCADACAPIPPGIDTPADLERARQRFAGDGELV